ncbi:ABC transporter ATP-binding protein [Gluconacetobacter takamatsuzukensis]|uniref:ABC transporter ATP-binding protein n=1 Tax=Gluconacetobacter takamatsuzukensis TaxID=1286190 RepID=A0A7W4PPQ8_9PROT|nr:ABC transporter ATP-binding protein [Gluconacetobacter takamatsuzukensis]MBB2203844.1 ABC transporter ATP-binding protein [Gluconacetobacter takamatsuzukensis]
MTGLAARGVTLSLGGRRVLHEASVGVAPGEIVGVIGPNGAGKSTLLRALAGIQRPDAGVVMLDGRELAGMAPGDRARRLSFLPQEEMPPPPMRVEDLVAFGRLPHRAARDEARDRAAVARALGETGLLDLRGRPGSQLSGGERARLRLARALAVEAPYLLADEPVAALDPAHALAVMASFGRLAEGGRGVAVVLHDLTLAGRFCHRLVLMRDGRVAAHGRPAEILTDAAMRAVYGVTVRRVGDAVVPWSLTDGRSEEKQVIS